MDVLTDLLERSRARGATFAHSTVHGPFGLRFAGDAALGLHAVASGEVLLTRRGVAPLRLLGGDVVLVRGDLAHELRSPEPAAAEDLAAFAAACAVPGSPRRFVRAGDGEPAVFLCGAYRFAGDLCDRLLDALPEVVHVRPALGAPLEAALTLLAREMERDAPGQQTVLDRLLDVVLVGVLREHFGRAGAGAPPWYRALDDPQVGRALRALHADPARPWTVAALAAEVGLSRAAFARRFTALVGEPPLEYLTGWRMALAREQLRETRDGLAAVARAVGYGSEFAFAAAFKRHHGVAPGRWRTLDRPPAREVIGA